MDKPEDCSSCDEYQERAAIIEYDDQLPRIVAEKLARREVCLGCDGELGIDLFSR